MSALLLVFRPPCTLLFARGCGLETLAHDRNSCFTNGKKSSLNTDFFHTYTARKPQSELVWMLDSWFQKVKKMIRQNVEKGVCTCVSLQFFCTFKNRLLTVTSLQTGAEWPQMHGWKCLLQCLHSLKIVFERRMLYYLAVVWKTSQVRLHGLDCCSNPHWPAPLWL